MVGSVIRNAMLAICLMVIGVIVVRDHTGLTDAIRAKSVARTGAAAPAVPAAPRRGQHVADNGERLVIDPGPGGHYLVEAAVNGRDIEMLVDTGATMVALSRDDAQRLGIAVYQLEFDGRVQTANGVGRVARVTLDEIMIGEIRIRNVPAAVIDAPMEMSLLGMTFLGRLAGFGVEDGRLVLRR